MIRVFIGTLSPLASAERRVELDLEGREGGVEGKHNNEPNFKPRVVPRKFFGLVNSRLGF